MASRVAYRFPLIDPFRPAEDLYPQGRRPLRLYNTLSFSSPRCACTATVFFDCPVRREISVSERSCAYRMRITFWYFTGRYWIRRSAAFPSKTSERCPERPVLGSYPFSRRTSSEVALCFRYSSTIRLFKMWYRKAFIISIFPPSDEVSPCFYESVLNQVLAHRMVTQLEKGVGIHPPRVVVMRLGQYHPSFHLWFRDHYWGSLLSRTRRHPIT